jgi:hypothetical protein
LNNLSSTIDCNDINNVYLINGISGLKNSQFGKNFKSMYMKEGEINNGIVGSFEDYVKDENLILLFRRFEIRSC